MPRHTGQAQKISKIADIRSIIYLECPENIVYERIKINSGGDRSERTDDTAEEIRNKLRIFNDRTLELLEYFNKNKVKIIRINISKNTGPE